jgi:hypothetical protein
MKLVCWGLNMAIFMTFVKIGAVNALCTALSVVKDIFERLYNIFIWFGQNHLKMMQTEVY